MTIFLRKHLLHGVIVVTIALFLSLLMILWLGYDLRNFSNFLIAPNEGDSIFTEWIFYQTIDNLIKRPTQLGYATIFFNEPNALAYTSSNYGMGIIGLPVYLIGNGNLVLVYNFYFVLTFVLTVYTSFILIRYLLNSSIAIALLMGLMVAFAQNRTLRLTQLDKMSTFTIILMLYFLHRLIDRPSFVRSILFGIICAITFLIDGYSFFIGLVAVVVVVVYLLLKYGVNTQLLLHFCVSGVVAIILILPFITFRLGTQLIEGQPIEQTIFYSAELGDWFVGNSQIYYDSTTFNTNESNLFLGFTPIVLVIATWMILGKNRKPDPLSNITGRRFSSRDIVVIYTLIAIFGYILTLGPILKVGDQHIAPLPYTLLLQIPGFSTLRVPARFVFLPMIATGVLGAYTLNYLSTRINRRLAYGILGIVAILLFLELLPYNGVPTSRILQASRSSLNERSYSAQIAVENQPVYEWLRSLEEVSPILNYPVSTWDDFYYMGGIKWHNQPIVNGVSSIYPTWYYSTDWSEFPNPTIIDLLKEREVRYVLIHFDRINDAEELTLREDIQSSQLQLIHVFDNVEVYSVP